ncbi:MAG: lipopolysaccharide biosynthesis protein [Bacteroidaceae bacterium]|nr:lipopolysaccharide biosynthesis protein [Bacteroidaceae bacterium]
MEDNKANAVLRNEINMSNLKGEMIKGVFWNAIEKYTGIVIGMMVSMVLARILTPKDYGTVAIVTVFTTFLGLFSSMGLAPAIIQRKDLTKSNLDSIYTYSILIALFLGSILFFSSWGIASFYEDSKLVIITQVLTVPFFFSTINMVPGTLMVRDKRFKLIARRSLLLGVISAIISVGAALLGAGLYSLIIAPLLTTPVVFFWNQYYYHLKIDRTFDIEPIKRVFSFSAYVFLFDFFNYFSRNLDKLIIGKFLNLSALGIYEKSYRLMQLPMSNITFVIHPVMQPVLRDFGEDHEELGRKYAKIVKFITTLSFTLGFALYGLSAECIHFFYGGRWDAAIPVFGILALSIPLQMILSTSGPIYMVCNASKMQFWLGVRNTVTTVAGFLIAAFAFGTIESMAWAWTITLFINFVFTYYLMYRYVLKISILPMLRELVKPAIIAMIVYAVILIFDFLGFKNDIVALIVKSVAAVVAFVLSVQLLHQYNIFMIINNEVKKIQKK